MLLFSVPPGYRRGRPPQRPTLDAFIGIIGRIVEKDKRRPAIQRRTSRRIFARLRDEHGYSGGITVSLVRYRGNDYSAPTEYGHREVLVRGYVHEGAIARGAAEIARHLRSYEMEDFGYNPLYYLALLERKVGALDQAAPLAGWTLPDGVRHAAPAARGAPGHARQARVRPGAAPAGGVSH